MDPATSVVVPTRDRPAALSRCLAALEAQDAGVLEIVVVDDGSADREAVAAAVEAAPRARLVTGPGRGPAAARNLGAHSAHGGILAFTDDDCAPEPRWASRLGRAAAQGPAAGITRNAVRGAAPAAAQAITNHLQRSSLAADGSLAFAPTCNLAVPAALFAQLRFDESYRLPAGEDRDWCARAVAAGHPIRFVADAVVAHHHPMNVAAFLRQQLGYGRGAARFHRARPPGAEFHRPRPVLYAGFLRAGFREGAGAGALVGAAQLATGAGFALERLRPSSP